MSAKATFWAWDQRGLSSAEKLVLLCLADCHNADTGRCDPSDAFIAEKTDLDRKTVPAARKRLVLRGLISCERRAGKSPMTTLHIQGELLPNSGIPKNGDTPKTGIPENGDTPKTGIPKNGQGVSPKTGGGVYPKTGYEPKREPKKNLEREILSALEADSDRTLPDDWLAEAMAFWRQSGRPDLDPVMIWEDFKAHDWTQSAPLEDWHRGWVRWYTKSPRVIPRRPSVSPGVGL